MAYLVSQQFGINTDISNIGSPTTNITVSMDNRNNPQITQAELLTLFIGKEISETLSFVSSCIMCRSSQSRTRKNHCYPNYFLLKFPDIYISLCADIFGTPIKRMYSERRHTLLHCYCYIILKHLNWLDLYPAVYNASTQKGFKSYTKNYAWHSLNKTVN